MTIPRADASIGQRLKKIEDAIRAIKLAPTVTQGAVAPSAVAKSSTFYDSSNGNAPSYWDGSAWVPVRDATIAVAQATADAALAEATPDGVPPTTSPDPMVLSGIDAMYVRWTPITNADPVWYDVHISATLGFTPDSTTLVGSTQASQFAIKALPGPEPAAGEEDPRKLAYDTAYYIRIIARDADGSAAPSLQAVGSVFQVTGVNLAADSVTAANIVAGTLTGELFAATVILAGIFKTAEAGQRVEMGVAGIQGYKSDGSLMINFPTDPAQTALIDAEIIARGLTVTNGATFRSASFLETDAKLTLQSATSPPVSVPQMQPNYTTIQPVTTGLAAANKTGELGTFDLVPTEVSFMEWKASGTYWVIHQIRPGGTRAWFFNTDGTPRLTGGEYFHDYGNWEIWSVIEITTSTTAKNGVYRMARWIPNNTYYLMCPQGVGYNRYSRQNGAAPPVVGSNGTDVFIAEVINTDDLSIKYYVPNGDGNNLSAPTTAYESSTGYTASIPLSTVYYDATGFDVSSGTGARYLTSYRGNTNNNKIIQTSGTNLDSIFPSGSGLSWTSTTKDAHSFEVPTANPRCVAWDGSNFWTYGGDGFLYQHSTNFWDPSVTSSTAWAELTFYDSDATGGTHESTPGPAKSFFWKRRSSIQFSLPPIPDNGGTDDPDQIRIYMGRGATQPANTAMWRQLSTSGTSATVSVVTLSGSNPPTVNTFPSANPGKVRNADDTLVISGDGSIKGTSFKRGTDDVAIDGPYWYGYLNTAPAAPAAGTLTTITGWAVEGSPGSSGITHSSGIFTLPTAGRYRIMAQLWFGAVATCVGRRLGQINRISPVATIQNNAIIPPTNTTAPGVVSLDKTFRFAAGEQVRVQFLHDDTTSAANRVPTTGADLTFIQIQWVGL